MKDFKHTGRGPQPGHSFPSSRGFSGSAGSSQSIGPYTRRVPGFAKGGRVKAKGNALVQRNKPVTQADKESGGKTPLRPGFKRGGKAMGGPVTMKKGGKRPSGRGFNREPLVGGHNC